jgi:hypothetical protein
MGPIMNSIPELLSRLSADAAALETANANHEPPDRVLVASSANLMRWAAETIKSIEAKVHS